LLGGFAFAPTGVDDEDNPLFVNTIHAATGSATIVSLGVWRTLEAWVWSIWSR
jgi:hypothetical protein